MNATGSSLRAFGAVMRRDLHVYLSYRTRLFSQLLTALFSLTLFYYVSRLVHVSGFRSHDSYFGFVVVGISLISVLYSCFSIPELVRQELIAGTFDRLLLSPFGAVRSVLAMTFLPRPEVVLLDEPLTSLDAEGAELLLAAVAELLERDGALLWCSPSGEHLDISFDAHWMLERGALVPA